MSDTPYKYFLHSKSSFNSLYTLNLLFLHIPECNLLVTKVFKTHDEAFLESSEEERSTPYHLYYIRNTLIPLLSPHGSTWNFTFIILFFIKNILQKLSCLFFNNLKNKITFLLFLFKYKDSIPKLPHTASLYKYSKSNFLHVANNTAFNTLD